MSHLPPFRLPCAPLLVAAVMAVAGGCATEPGQSESADTTKYTLENTDKFTVIDRTTLQAISCTGLHMRPIADGRMEIVANLKNRDSRPARVEASCVFKDALFIPTGQETPWQSLVIAPNTTETVRFTAPNAAVKNYTIRVRQGR